MSGSEPTKADQRPKASDMVATESNGKNFKDIIIEAALDAFGRNGYDGTSLREINRGIGASHNLIYHYFGSKLKLWRAAIDSGFSRMGNAWVESDSNTSSKGIEYVLRQGVRQQIEATAANPSLQRILEQEAAVGGERLDYIFDNHLNASLQDAVLNFGHKIDVGEGRELNLASLVLFVASGTNAFFTQAALARKLGGPEPFSPEGVERHIDTISRLLLYGLIGQPTGDEQQATNRP